MPDVPTPAVPRKCPARWITFSAADLLYLRFRLVMTRLSSFAGP